MQVREPAKGGMSFADRVARVNLMIERAEHQDDKLDDAQQALARFSDEAIDLRIIIEKLGQQKDVCSRDYLTQFFKTFYLERSGVESIDEGI